MKKFADQNTKKRGVSMIEYGILAALIGVASIIAIQYLGASVSNNYCHTSQQLHTVGSTASNPCSEINTQKPVNQDNNTNLVWYGTPSSLAATWTTSSNPTILSQVFTLQNMSSTTANNVMPLLINENSTNTLAITNNTCSGTLSAWEKCTVTVQSTLTSNTPLSAIMTAQDGSGTAETFNDSVTGFQAPTSNNHTTTIALNQPTTQIYKVTTISADLNTVSLDGNLPPGTSFGNSLSNISHNTNTNNLTLTGTPTTAGTYVFTLTMTTRAGLTASSIIHLTVS